MELKICHLYPDVLNLYGDVGNIICMKKRLQWRGIDVSVTDVKMGQELDGEAFDLIFIGSGREDEQLAVLADLHEHKAAALRSAALNVYVNTRLMQDSARIEKLNMLTEQTLAKALPQTAAVYADVATRLKG